MSDMGFADTLSAVLRRSLGPMAAPEVEGSHPFPGTAGGRVPVPRQDEAVPVRGQARAGVPFPNLDLAGGPPRGELPAHCLPQSASLLMHSCSELLRTAFWCDVQATYRSRGL